MKLVFFVSSLYFLLNQASACTETTVKGSKAPASGSFCSGDLIFEDLFDDFNLETWRHEVTFWGGGNDEFQWYLNDRSNSYANNGVLHFNVTYTADVYGEEFLRNGRVYISAGTCTIPWDDGCDRTGTPDRIISPMRSARITTTNSFNFKFGTLEIRAKVPAGDWLWPALWLMPKDSVYGDWPTSGEIDLMEMRGNKLLFDTSGVNVGVEQVGSTLHFGPQGGPNAYMTSHYVDNRSPGWNEDFHRYKMIWTPSSIQFLVDDVVLGTIEVTDGGFWERGNFEGTGFENPWSGGTLMAPFDQEFYIIMNLAIGGNFFDESFSNTGNPKPWTSGSSRAATDFWETRSAWEPTWNDVDSQFLVDYVRVWAL